MTESSESICFVIERVIGRSGGAERIMIELANWLATQGFPVRIVSYESKDGQPFYPLSFGVIHSNIRPPDKIRHWCRCWIDRLRLKVHGGKLFIFPFNRLSWWSKHGGFERALERDLALHRPSVAVAFLPPAIVALGRVRTPYGLRRIASVHNVPQLDLASPTRWDPNPLDVRRRIDALESHDVITVLLDEFKDWFPTVLQKKVKVIPNPVPKAAAGREQREKLVIAVGRLAEVKRHKDLIGAWANLIDDYPDWRLEIYGTGPLRNALHQQIAFRGLQASVNLMGHVTTIEMAYQRAAILAHPAAYEGWGLAVTEALSHGVPAIGFEDCPGVNKLILHDENGLLASSKGSRSDNLQSALRDLMSDDIRRHQLGAKGPASMDYFEPERVRFLWLEALFPEITTISALNQPSGLESKNSILKTEDLNC